MTTYKIIVNPVAGRGAGERAIPQIEGVLSEYGLDFDLVRTEAPWHAANLAQEAVAAGYDGVVAVGGDGTANEVLNGLMRAKQAGAGTCPMGILCVGRGNDFAYGMGIPTDLETGCQVWPRATGARWTSAGSSAASIRRAATSATAGALASTAWSALRRSK